MQNIISFWLISGFLLQESEKEVVRLKQTLQRSEKELQELRTALSEKDQKHKRRTARHEQQSKRWAQDIHRECVCLQELLKHNGLAVENKNSSDRCVHLFVLHTVCSRKIDFYPRHCAPVLMWVHIQPVSYSDSALFPNNLLSLSMYIVFTHICIKLLSKATYK